jgi:hypothetical protein
MQHRGTTLQVDEATELRHLIERVGERQARDYLTVSAQTLARAVGQMHLQRGTAAMIRQRLASLRGAA